MKNKKGISTQELITLVKAMDGRIIMARYQIGRCWFDYFLSYANKGVIYSEGEFLDVESSCGEYEISLDNFHAEHKYKTWIVDLNNL